MIIENQASVTDAVLEVFSRTADPRLKEILLALVRHLHGFVREVRLTEREFQEATRIIAAMGERTTDSHNEDQPETKHATLGYDWLPLSCGRIGAAPRNVGQLPCAEVPGPPQEGHLGIA